VGFDCSGGANLSTYYLATAANIGADGNISPATGWYTSGQMVQVGASPAAGYVFTGFSGGLTGSASPQNAAMNGPMTITANFARAITLQPAPTLVIPNNNRTVSATYTLALGDPTGLGGSCSTWDPNVSAQISRVQVQGQAGVQLQFQASSQAKLGYSPALWALCPCEDNSDDWWDDDMCAILGDGPGPQVWAPTISGTVTRKATNQGVPGVTINLQDANNNNSLIKATTTASDGTYSFAVNAGGSYKVVPSLVGNVSYYFSPSSSLYNNVNTNYTANFTEIPITTVYLIHGIGQGHSAMASLYGNLANPWTGIDPTRFQVDAGFDFSECATQKSCTTSQYGDACSVSAGGKSLAHYILQNPPPGDIVLVGYSMGGLIARDMSANNYYQFAPGPNIAGLITLGTPNLGYPYDPIDETRFCPQLVRDMSGGWWTARSAEFASSYLTGLISNWAFFNGGLGPNAYWMAAAGEYCANATRIIPPTGIGCLSSSARSDCIVCKDSALYSGAFAQNPPFPAVPWRDSLQVYVHTDSYGGWGSLSIFGAASGNPGVTPEIFNPQPGDPLLLQIEATINGH
jgi:pimeloyl-ACP methyl ester carboxylesterase